MPFRAMFILSARALVVPCAQHEPQYCGMCWFRVWLTKFFPLMFRQSQTFGRSSIFIVLCGSGAFLKRNSLKITNFILLPLLACCVSLMCCVLDLCCALSVHVSNFGIEEIKENSFPTGRLFNTKLEKTSGEQGWHHGVSWGAATPNIIK